VDIAARNGKLKLFQFFECVRLSGCASFRGIRL